MFEDIGNDGYFDSGTDFGINNVTVWLYEDSDNNGVIGAGDALVATTTSSGSGDYSFTSLAAGYSYLVKVDKTDPDIQSYFNTKYPPSTVYQISTAEVTASPNLTGSDLDNDFGFWRAQPGSIGDQVFVDNNANGVYDAGDAVLPLITVNLYKDTNGNGVLDSGEPLLETTTTDAYGVYTFGNLGPGNYIVDVDQHDANLPAGLSATKDPIATTLTAGQTRTDIDFPFVSVLTKTVDKAIASPGDTLTFTINPYYPGPQLLANTLIQDTVPPGTTFLSASQGGGLNPFTPARRSPGEITTLTTGMAVYAPNSNTPAYRVGWHCVRHATNIGERRKISGSWSGAAAPTRNEKIVVGVASNSPKSAAERWNGTSWARAPATNPGARHLCHSSPTCGVAPAYEQFSGDAVLVWEQSQLAGSKLRYTVWNGSAYSPTDRGGDRLHRGRAATNEAGGPAQLRRDAAGS